MVLILITEKYKARVTLLQPLELPQGSHTILFFFFSHKCKIMHLVHRISSFTLIALQARKLKTCDGANWSPWNPIFFELMHLWFDLCSFNFAGADSRKSVNRAMSCKVERMNYERMLVSAVVRYELQYLFECAPVAFTALHAALRNGGRTGERGGTGERLWREGLVWVGVVLFPCGCCVSAVLVCAAAVCAVAVGFQLRAPRREGKDLSGKEGAGHGLREKQGQCLRAALQWSVTDKMFSKCGVVHGGTFWVWIWAKYSCFSTFHYTPMFCFTKRSSSILSYLDK